MNKKAVEGNTEMNDKNKEKIGRRPTPREWAKWAGYDCGE